MVRICVVPGCNSGSSTDLKQRAQDEVRKCSLFKAPKDPLHRMKWADVLGIELNDNSKVCELHFLYEDLCLEDDLVYCNDRWVVSVREKIKLKKNAFPQCSLQHDNYQQRKEREHGYCNSRAQMIQKVSEENSCREEEQCKFTAEKIIEKMFDDDITMEPEDSGCNKTNEGENAIDVNTFSNNRSFERDSVLQNLVDEINKSNVRQNWAWTEKDCEILFTFFDPTILEVRCQLQVHPNKTVTFLLRDQRRLCNFSGITSVDSFGDLTKILVYLENQHLCIGISADRRSEKCRTSTSKTESRCIECTAEANKNDCILEKHDNFLNEYALLQKKLSYCGAKYNEAKLKIKDLENQIDNGLQNYQEELLDSLPEIQREIVSMFIKFSKTDKRNFRYSRDWICESFLIHTKSSALYEYLRERGILPLPSPNTLRTQTGSIDTNYGFQDAVFESLEIKASCLENYEKHGILIADEISLSEAVGLDKNWIIQGYTDYGCYTPDKLENVQADHALCLLFVPFRGGWAQPIAAFAASKTTGDILDHVLIECIKRIESAGLIVDAVGMDAANVNRKVWKNNGITESNISCPHPINSSRRLWFISDQSHLWKNLRTQIMKLFEFWTPDGIVKKEHWEAVIECESHLQYNLKCAYFLTPDHLDPKGYMTMNVLMAIQIFSERVHLAMEMYKNHEKSCGKLKDCEPTIAFIKRMKALIDAMRSRSAKDALYLKEDCPRRQAITSFIAFLEEWKKGALEKNMKFPLTQNTYTGFIVTLKASLELLDYLHKECGYEYLMTNHLCSDPIERLFGILRISAGSNDNPDPILFACLFKIFCTYGLIKSPKGSNVVKGEVLEVLINTKDSRAVQLDNKTKLVDAIFTWVSNYKFGTIIESSDHIYGVVNTDERLISDISGWVVREIIKTNVCQSCNLHLEAFSSSGARHQLTNSRELFGGLVRSSDEVFQLIKMLENTVTFVIGTDKGICKNLMIRIVEQMIKNNLLIFVGCNDHKKKLTFKFITYYLERRVKMACNRHNIVHSAAKKKAKDLRKNAKHQ